MKLAIFSSVAPRSLSKILLCLFLWSSWSYINAENNLAYSANTYVNANQIRNLWKGLLAEASGEGYEGMYAVACCVRNRFKAGMDHGLVGLRRKDLEHFVWKESQETRQLSIQSIDNVFCHNGLDVTNGATFFESIDFIKNFKKWSRNKVILAHIGKHYFYNYK